MGLLETLQIPSSTLDVFIRSVEISAYLPGRVRLYAKSMVGNPSLEAEVRRKLLAFKEIESVETSLVTGSILILYQPAVLRSNPELAKAEAYIMTPVKGR